MQLVVAILLAAGLVFWDHHSDDLTRFRSHLSVVVYPVQWVADLPSKWMNSTNRYWYSVDKLKGEIKHLRQEQLINLGKLQKLSALEAENHRLRALLQSSDRKNDTLLIAEIMQVDPDPFSQQVLLSKGNDDEVYLGQPIIDENGLVGSIVEISPITSRAMLITDVSHAVPVENTRNGSRAIAVGTGEASRLELQHVPLTADFNEGDLLVTSGLGGKYPPGYPVGKVMKKIYDVGAPFLTIELEPVAKLGKSRQILLIKPGYKESQS